MKLSLVDPEYAHPAFPLTESCKLNAKGKSVKGLKAMWTHVTPAHWCGHHLTHAHNLTTRAGISKPSTAVSAMLSVIGMTWPKLCPPLLLAFSPDGPTCELSSFI